MATFTPGAMVEDIRGTLNNVVYTVAKGGVHVVKNRPISPNNFNTVDQAAARARLQEAGKDWRALIDAEKATWEEVALRCAGLAMGPGGGVTSIVPPIGFKGSGFNAYVAFRTRALLAGVTLVDFNTAWRLGVATEQQPTPPIITSLTCVAGTATADYTDPVTKDAACKIAYWFRTRDKIVHPQIKAYDVLGVLSYPFTQIKCAQGKSVPLTELTGAILIAQFQTVNPSGWASPGSNTLEVAIA